MIPKRFIERVPFDINYPIRVLQDKKVNFGDKKQRERILRRNIYYYLYRKRKNNLLEKRGDLLLKLAKKLKIFLNKNTSFKILSISAFGSSLYTYNNKDFDFLVIVAGNKFSYIETELKISKDNRCYKIGISLKGIDNFTRGLCDEKSHVSLNKQSQIIYRTSVSLYRRHIPIIGYDFKNNKNLFYKNGYSQVCDLLYNTYNLYYLDNKYITINKYRRSQKILSRLFEALAYLSLLCKDFRINSIKKKILYNKTKKVKISESQLIFNRVLQVYDDNIKMLVSPKRKRDDVLKILSSNRARVSIISRLENYWRYMNLPYHWINPIINILAKYKKNEDRAIKEVRKVYPQLDKEKSEYFKQLGKFRKIKVINLAKRISEHLYGNTLVDVGGRSDDLAERILDENRNISKVYVTDLSSFTKRSNNKKVKFIVQSSKTSIPLKKNSVDNILLSMVLHHLNIEERRKMIETLHSILKPKGRIILIEDSFPEKINFKSLSQIMENFLKLTIRDKKKILYFYDWFGNRLMRSRDNISIYNNYKTIEEWTEIFRKRDMEKIYFEFIKENKEHPDLFPPKAIIVFEKK